MDDLKCESAIESGRNSDVNASKTKQKQGEEKNKLFIKRVKTS